MSTPLASGSVLPEQVSVDCSLREIRGRSGREVPTGGDPQGETGVLRETGLKHPRGPET